MAITAIEKLTTADFVPESERESDNPTVFRLRPLDGLQYLEVMGEGRADENGNVTLGANGLRKAVRYGLVGWDNFLDGSGKPVKFNPMHIQKLPPVILAEIGQEIISRSEIGEGARKNS